MRAATIIIRGLAWLIIAMLVMPAGIQAQDTVAPEQADRFTKEELGQMLAPIALYPDSLIAQILMASTYPLEVVDAERWLRQNKNLKGDELDNALLEKTWDASVKSLCHFPDILFAMSEKLDQTRKLGDAFLSQEDDVMATIQELRLKAEDQGNLKTTNEQQVIVEKEVIRIVPADPEVVYVPVYDPLCVYGPWWYPAYPPYYWYYPPGFVASGCFIGFGPRIFIGIDLFSWCWFDWHFHHIFIDTHKTRRFHRHRDKRDLDKHFWRHDPGHRKGVAYRDRRTSERFGLRPSRVSPASPETRGYPGKRIEGQNGKPAQGPIERREGTGTLRERPGTERIQVPERRDTPFSGVGSGNFERKASERGGTSRQSGEMKRQGGEIRPQRGDTGRQSGDGMDRGGASGIDKGGGFRR